jgi:hypothetical protein
MRRVSALVAALSLTAAGCSFSSVDPDTSVHVTGRALDASGKPLADRQVLLLKQADIGEVILGSALAVGTLATICLLPEAPAICDKARKARTDSDGRYEFDLTGQDTQGSLGTESTMNVVFSGGRGKTSTTVSFGVEDNEVSLPDAKLWDPDLRATSGIRMTWSPLRGAGDVDYRALLFTADGSAIWSQPAARRSATVDPRILEDRPGSVAVSARTTQPGTGGTGEVGIGYLSPHVPVRAVAGAPPSRGRPCAPVTGTAPARTGSFGRCGLTDGMLDAPARLTGGNPVVGAAVDLGRVRPIDLVVGRGFAGQVLIEISTDGRTWRPVATSAGAAIAQKITGSPSGRFVRLRSPSGLDESLAHEISVW